MGRYGEWGNVLGNIGMLGDDGGRWKYGEVGYVG